MMSSAVLTDPMQFVVLAITFVAGSGLIDRDLWPYIFYYVVAPVISGFVGAKLLETIPSLGMDFGLDRYVDYAAAKQIELARAAGIGFATGFVLNRIAARFSGPKKKKLQKLCRRFGLIDEDIPMARRRHLNTLGLKNSAGPRDMFLAWTQLSKELQGPKWEEIAKARGLDCSETELKEWIDEAYNWLRENSDAPVSVNKKRAAPERAAATTAPKKKKSGRSFQKSSQPKMQIRGL